ncbi:hypothetical protein [Brevibacillus sp. 179-C 1.1 NHS]|uniref:hypothetical protein n=1 Tax=Brevibacillus sp. 179-C 1.1 NHS TaxID=3235177 RepID=UPI0039A0BFE6
MSVVFALLIMTGSDFAQATSPDSRIAQTGPSHTTSQATKEWKQKELPYDYAAMKEDVVIQLNEAPQLRSPRRTVVGPAPQSYTFFFKEAVNRGTVETAIRNNAKEETKKEGVGYVEPIFTFHWVHDRQLQLLAALPDTLANDRDWTEYVLNVAGAKTAKGNVLDDKDYFRAVVFAPSQIWRVSVDGKVKEKMTDFAVRTPMEFIDPEERYVLLERFTKYCECDARFPMLYSIYDTQTRELTSYPVELTDNYSGAGDFMADRRGFFFSLPPKGTDVPKSEFASQVKVDGYVHGASFSLDRKHLLMAVGKAEQKKDLDLVVYDFATGKQRRHPGVIKGWVPTDEMNGQVQPVSFIDDGRYATFEMRTEEEGFEELRQRYDWKMDKVISWNPPVPKDAWSGYIQSTDGAYHMYWNAGVFKGDAKLMEVKPEATWIPGTHHLVYVDWEKAEQGADSVQSLFLFDADRKQQSVLVKGLPTDVSILGASNDGKWLYIKTSEVFAP